MNEEKNELVPLEISVETLKSKIYLIRGQRVMFAADLAEIYGYTTKTFNQQINRNIERFDEDFRFQLTREELDDLVRSQNVTSREETMFRGQSGGTRYLPWCFTESGIYMLMTVLKGDLAIRQSKALIRTFKAITVEVIALLSKRKPDFYVKLSLNMEDYYRIKDKEKS